MFTVKYIAPSGEENITECLSVIADRTSDGNARVLVFDEQPRLHKDNSAGVYVGLPAIPGEAPQMHDGIVYVMNRFGATVATYRL